VGGLVYAYDKDLRTEALLGKAITNEAGYYEITYSPDKLGKANKGNADLQVRVIEQIKDGEEKILVVSEIFFNAVGVQEINLSLPATTASKEKSEWEILNEQVLPLLKGQQKINVPETGSEYTDLPAEKLTTDDIDFICKETGLERLAINAWVASKKMFNDAVHRLDAEHPAQLAIVSEYGWLFFYSLARQGLSDKMEGVLQQSGDN